jgi:hypothetical protein
MDNANGDRMFEDVSQASAGELTSRVSGLGRGAVPNPSSILVLVTEL